MRWKRPRLSKTTDDKLTQIKEELEFLEEEEDEDVSDYKGESGKVTNDQIINEALEALQDRGLIK